MEFFYSVAADAGTRLSAPLEIPSPPAWDVGPAIQARSFNILDYTRMLQDKTPSMRKICVHQPLFEDRLNCAIRGRHQATADMSSAVGVNCTWTHLAGRDAAVTAPSCRSGFRRIALYIPVSNCSGSVLYAEVIRKIWRQLDHARWDYRF